MLKRLINWIKTPSHSSRLLPDIIVVFICYAILAYTKPKVNPSAEEFDLVNLSILVYKILEFSLIVIVVHFSRSFVFWYIDLREMIFGTDRALGIDPIVRAAVIFGMLVMIGLLVSGLLSAL